jgi:polyisoprenyl-phosphate glycosyltransferase
MPAKLAIVIPIYDEAETLPELFSRLRRVLDSLIDIDATVIYVNDGSRDESLSMMLAQRADDPRFTVLDLSRNFGHQAALTAGLAAAEGHDAVVMLDGDLQDPPELIVELVASWRAGAEVVQAVRIGREEQGVRKIGFWLFYRLLDWISDFPLPAHTGIFGLLNAQALSELNRLSENNRFLPGLRAWIGFDQRTIHYQRPERAMGKPKQDFFRLARYAIDGFVSFSYKPLRLMITIGCFISCCGFFLALAFILRRLLGYEIAQIGFTTLVTLVLFLGGVQLVAIGLLGEYLGRVYDEVKHRPLYIVRRRYQQESNSLSEVRSESR